MYRLWFLLLSEHVQWLLWCVILFRADFVLFFLHVLTGITVISLFLQTLSPMIFQRFSLGLRSLPWDCHVIIMTFSTTNNCFTISAIWQRRYYLWQRWVQWQEVWNVLFNNILIRTLQWDEQHHGQNTSLKY